MWLHRYGFLVGHCGSISGFPPILTELIFGTKGPRHRQFLRRVARSRHPDLGIRRTRRSLGHSCRRVGMVVVADDQASHPRAIMLSTPLPVRRAR